MTGLASSSSTPMGWPMAYCRIYHWSVHRDWRDGAGLRCPSSCVGSLPSLRVRGVGLGVYDANECCVPSMPSYRRSAAFRGGLRGTIGHIMSIEGRSIVWDVGRDVGPIVQDREQALLGVEGVHRQCMAPCDSNSTPPGCNVLGERYVIVLFPMSSPIL